MRWFKRQGNPPAARVLTRQQGDPLSEARGVAAARARTFSAGLSAAVEAAAGQWSRGLGAVRVEGAGDMIAEALGPEHFERAGRDLLLHGNSVWAIEVADGMVKLIEASPSFDVRGSADPASWTYRVDLLAPDDYPHHVLAATAVVHYRLPGGWPWRGASPLTQAVRRLDLGAEVAAEQESGKAAVDVLEVGARNRERIAYQITQGNLSGILPLFVVPGLPKQDEQWTSPMAVAARGAYEPIGRRTRLGPDPTGPMVDLLAAAQDRVLAAAGVPPALFDRVAAGAGQREAWRRFLHSTLAPIGRLIEAELRLKLEVPALKIAFDDLFASDLSGRARAFQSLVGAGMDPARAAALAGLMEPDE